MRLRIKHAAVCGGLVVCLPMVANAADVHVDARNGGSENGSTTGPYRTIQAAVKAASKGDRIKIAGGTYNENISVRGKGLVFEGGFIGAPANVYASGGQGDFGQSNPTTNETEIHGNRNAPVISAEGTVETTVDGLVIKGGKQGIEASGYPEARTRLVVRRSRIEGNGTPSTRGGGIRAQAELLVEDSIVRGNIGDRGAGIASGPVKTRVVRTVIENNTSHGDHGGGFYAAGDVEVQGCILRNNRAGETAGYGWGGGLIVFNEGTKATITDTEVRGNYAPTKGSGVFVDDGAEATLRNVLIVDNQCAKEGAALYVDGLDEKLGSRAHLINVTIAGHDCKNPGFGNALMVQNASVVTATSSIFWNNGPLDVSVLPGNRFTATYTNSRDGLPGQGNLKTDPLFANPSAGDYRLMNASGRWDPVSKSCVKDAKTSPCVDAGDPKGSYDREPEPNGGRVDMGAFGNSPLAGCAPKQTFTELAPAAGSVAPSLGPSTSGAARGRCGCDLSGSSSNSALGWLSSSFLALFLTFRRRRNL